MIEIAGRYMEMPKIRELLKTDHPLVQEFDFQVEFEDPGRHISFILEITPKRGVEYWQQRDTNGNRIKPVRRVLSGTETIGSGYRALSVTNTGELVAHNCTFFPNQKFNDLGIGSALYVSMERLYRALGIREVSLLAVDIGVYVWARQGFDFSSKGEWGGVFVEFEKYANGLKPRRETYRHSWSFANERRGAVLDGDHFGKHFMLTLDRWRGVKYLNDKKMTEISKQSRRETFSRLADKIPGSGELDVI